MRVVIVGGTGNISTPIVDKLLKDGHEVVCFNRGISKLERFQNEVKYIHGDRNNEKFFINSMQSLKPDAAIDMVCFNKKQAKASIEAFRGVKHFVFCSTVCVYGVNPDSYPVTEDMPLLATDDYGFGKKEAEQVFLNAHKTDDFPVTIIRPSTTYGNKVGMVSPVGVNNLWVSSILANKPIAVAGSGNNVHQFMHVNDAAKVFVMALSLSCAIGNAYNLVGEKCVTWNDYCEIGFKVIGKKVTVVGIPLDLIYARGKENFGYAYDIFGHNSFYSSAKLKRDFSGFKQEITLEDGMSEVIKYCIKNNTLPKLVDDSVLNKAINDLLKLRGENVC